MDTLLMSLRYIEASIEGVMKKLEVLSVSTSDAQRCTEALNTFSIFNALSVLEEVTRDSMKTAVWKSGEKKQKAPYSAERSENNVADTSPVKLIKVENQSAVEEDSKVVQSSQLSDEDSANDESADGDDGTQTDDDVGDTGDVNDHEFKEEEEVHRRRRSGLRHIKKRSSRETKYSEDYSENKCKTCYKKFPNPTRLAIHMKSHDDSRPFRCHLCQKTFKYDRCLQQHLKVTHNDDRPEECEFCRKRFKDKRVLSMHLATHSERKFACSSCDMKFTLEAQLNRHVKVKHMGIYPHQCNVCGKKYARKSDCETHMFSHQGLKPWKCSQCHKSYTNAKSLRMHEDSHQGKSYACQQCGKVYGLKNSLQDHMKRCQKSEHEKSHSCPICEKKFWTKNNLQDHMMVHNTEKSLMCNQCGKMFRREINLKAHMITHTGERNFQCPQCSLAFGTKSNMDNHILRKHTDKSELPFRCQYCDKGLINKQELDQHILIHHTDHSKRPFKCETCGMAFVLKRHHRDHVRIHTGEKPYKCNLCQKCFTQSSTLQKHLKTHELGSTLRLKSGSTNTIKGAIMASMDSEKKQQGTHTVPVLDDSGQDLGESRNNRKEPEKLEYVYHSPEQRVNVQEHVQGHGRTNEGQGQSHGVEGRRECNELESSSSRNPAMVTTSQDLNYNPMAHSHGPSPPTLHEPHPPLSRPIETQYPVGIPPTLGVPPGVDTAQIIHNVLTFQSQNFPNYQYQ